VLTKTFLKEVTIFHIYFRHCHYGYTCDSCLFKKYKRLDFSCS